MGFLRKDSVAGGGGGGGDGGGGGSVVAVELSEVFVAHLRRRAAEEERGAERAALATEHASALQALEEEKATLIEGYLGKSEELQRAADALELLGSECAGHLRKLEEREGEAEALREAGRSRCVREGGGASESGGIVPGTGETVKV
jgi:hypothetical protein